MPFFTGENHIVKAITIISIKKTTLQVRIPNKSYRNISLKPEIKKDQVSCRGKRASSFVSRKICAGLTIEAAFCLSFMIFAMVILMLPMKIMNTRRQLQARLEAVNEQLCRYTYIAYRLEQGDEKLAMPDDYAAISLGYEWYAGSKLLAETDTARIRNVSMGRSSILTDDETIDLIFDYEVELPFSFFSLDAIPQSVRSCRRAWVGTSKIQGLENDTESEEDRIVYLGKRGTRYHYRRDCHYLSNQLQPVGREEADTLRNASGGKYHPCAVCGAGAQSVVYIMPNGSSYHTQMQCSAIIAYMQTAKLSQVIHLGGCSYCVK